MSAVGVNYSWGMDFSQEGAVVFRLESADYRTSASERTKRKIAQAFESVLKVKPFEKIIVSDITSKCGISRQTFYNHFLDKYDLINWYFDKLLLKSFEHMGEGTTVYDGLVKKFEYLKEEHLFFAAAFRSDDQNSLKEHDFELILEFYSNLIFQKTGRRPDAETSFLLEMYCRGSIYMTVKWLLGGMKFPPAQLAKQLVLGMPEKLVQLFTDLHILS